MGIMPELRWMVVDEGRVMYSERRFREIWNTILSVGIGRMISRLAGLCQIAGATTRSIDINYALLTKVHKCFLRTPT